MDKEYLVLWLEAPLQSWGNNSKFGVRDTLPFPTKSGIYGLLLAAMGASGSQEELLDTLSNCEQTILSFIPITHNGDDSLIRRKSQPLLMDFQMVGSGYDEKDEFQRLQIPRKKNGTLAVGGGAKMTYRYYLQNAYFAVIQEIPIDFIEIIENSLRNPVYDIYLGRKNCIPTDFIYRGIYTKIEEAQECINSITEEKNLFNDFIVYDGNHNDFDEMLTLSDVPIKFGEQKIYKERIVSIIKHHGQ